MSPWVPTFVVVTVVGVWMILNLVTVLDRTFHVDPFVHTICGGAVSAALGIKYLFNRRNGPPGPNGAPASITREVTP